MLIKNSAPLKNHYSGLGKLIERPLNQPWPLYALGGGIRILNLRKHLFDNLPGCFFNACPNPLMLRAGPLCIGKSLPGDNLLRLPDKRWDCVNSRNRGHALGVFSPPWKAVCSFYVGAFQRPCWFAHPNPPYASRSLCHRHSLPVLNRCRDLQPPVGGAAGKKRQNPGRLPSG